MTRHESRDKAFCLLFEYSFGGEPDEIINGAREYREEEISEFAKTLFFGTTDCISEIDSLIEKNVENRTFSRIGKIPLAAMRLATYEIIKTETPTEIIVNEALDLCREYNADESVSYINGVLAKIASEKRA